MVEELAAMAKGLEYQLNNKRGEIENSTSGLQSLQRRIDELQREHQDEFQVIKSRQNELTQLYSTYLDAED